VLDEEPETTLSDSPQSPADAKLSPQEADERARALFQQGRAAYEEGRYRDAWDYFRKAYLLSKRPALLYNVGQAADRLRMDREALEAFRLYLQRNPDADNRREVENRVRALEERLHQAPGTATPEGGAAPQAESESKLGTGQSETEIFGSGSPPAPPPPPPPPENGQPTRKGFYMRLALGVGVLADSIGGGGFSGSMSSLTIASQLGIGYDLDKGIVLGGMLLLDWSLSPTVKVGSAKNDVSAANLSMLGVFVDYFLEPRQDGWHLLGALAASAMHISDKSATLGNKTPAGGALIVGGGYEWPIDRQWAFGVLGRIILGRLADDARGHTIFTPSILATAAFY
jgi:hypothetical protein